jgi:IS605 OrfB family transposase
MKPAKWRAARSSRACRCAIPTGASSTAPRHGSTPPYAFVMGRCCSRVPKGWSRCASRSPPICKDVSPAPINKSSWSGAGRHYHWHVTVEDGAEPSPAPGGTVIAVDLGEIHPAALTDGKEAVVITARRLRATRQYTAKRLSEIASKQSGMQTGSRRWKQLQRRKHRFLAQQKKRTRDIEHKVSWAVVDAAVERRAGTLAIGDVRDVADGKRMSAQSQQKISLWSHGAMRQYITYKAQAAGITVELIDEHDTSKTCPRCKRQYKPKGRVYRCPRCGLVAHRDAVGAANILSRQVHGELAKSCRHRCTRRSIVTLPGRESVVPWTRGRWLAQAWLE